ncbi:MAG: hypothetical protein RL325_1948 [Planctomycetota bacterium]|jgi:hypothetical protein
MRRDPEDHGDCDDDEDGVEWRRDPLEDDPSVRPLLKQAEAEATAELAERGITMCIGYCHLHWATMQRILAEKHGIRWRSPPEMNPDILFD